MADDLYWVGGSGNWTDPMHWSDKPGGKSIGRPPGFKDNVFFEEKSFTAPNQAVIINTIAECRDMDWSGVTNTPRFMSDGDPNNDLTIYGSLKLSDQMIMAYDRPLYFRASTQGHVILLQGNSLNSDVFFQNNGGWTLFGDFDVSGHDIHLEQGQLNVQGDIDCNCFISSKALSRELTLNNWVITLEGTNQPVWSLNTDNLTINAGNSSVVVKGHGASFETVGSHSVLYNDVDFRGVGTSLYTEGSTAMFNDVLFHDDGSIAGNHSFANLTFSPGGIYELSPGDTQVVTNTFSAEGDCEQYITIKGNGDVAFIDASKVSITNIKVGSVTAKGDASPFKAIESFDLGSCSNWDIQNPIPKTYAWTGNASDQLWSTAHNWDGECVPTRIDNVVISSGAVVNIDQPGECKKLTLSGGSSLKGTAELSIFGSLMADGGLWELAGVTCFYGDQVHTINMGINKFNGDVIFEGSGSWGLLSEFIVNNHDIYLLSGSLLTNGEMVKAARFHSTGDEPRQLTLENSEVVLEGLGNDTWEVNGDSFTLEAGTSTIRFMGAGACMSNNLIQDIEYNNIAFASDQEQASLINLGSEVRIDNLLFEGNGAFNGEHTIGILNLTQGGEYLFQKGSTQIIENKINAAGSCKDFIVMKGEGGKAIIASAVNLDMDYVKMENMVAQGSKVYRVTGAIDMGENENWELLPPGPQDLHWTGAVGNNWFDPDNWNPECVPTRLDDVFFDNAIDEVNIPDDRVVAECHSMNWTGASPTAKFTGAGQLDVYGSFYLTDLQVLEYSGKLVFKSVDNQFIDLAGRELNGATHFEGDESLGDDENKGSWTFKGAFHSIGDVYLVRGEVISDNNDINVKSIKSIFTTKRSLLLGSSQVHLDALSISPENMTFDALNSVIHFNGDGQLSITKGAGPVAFNKVYFDEEGLAQLSSRADDVSFKELTFYGNANLQNGSLTIQTLTLSMGKTYRFQEGEIYDLGSLMANGGCEGFIDLATFSTGEKTTFNSLEGKTITVQGVNLQDIHANGDGLFIANESIDLGNNQGWTINEVSNGRILFWVNDGGDWNDTGHWSESSGGPSGACLPTALDDVIFDEHSFSLAGQVVEVKSNDVRCKTMDWSGAKFSPSFVSSDEPISGIYIYGSLYLIEDMDLDFPLDMNFYFLSNEPAQVIKSGGHIFPNDLIFDGLREDKLGEWVLFDDMRAEGDVIFNNGSLRVKGNMIDCKCFVSDNASSQGRVLDIENSLLMLSGYNSEAMNVFTFEDEELIETFDLKAENSTIRIKGDGSISFTGTKSGSVRFEKVIFDQAGKVRANRLKMDIGHLSFKGDGQIEVSDKGGELLFDVLEFYPGNFYKLQSDKEFVVRSQFLAQGNCNFPINIESTHPGQESTIDKSGDNIKLDFVYMKDIHVKDNGAEYLATNSQDGGNNDGWTITGLEPNVLYWVGRGETQEWGDYRNWSNVSGGNRNGCVPNALDDVIFDENSFIHSKNVDIVTGAFCHNMIWKATVDPHAVFNVNDDLTVAGSIWLNSNITVNFSQSLIFTGDNKSADKIVDLAGKALDGDVIFEGLDQVWKMESPLITSHKLSLKKGTLNTQNYSVEVGMLESVDYDSYNIRSLILGESNVKISSPTNGWDTNFYNNSGEYTFNLSVDENSTIEFLNGGTLLCRGIQNKPLSVTFGNVVFNDDGILDMRYTQGLFNEVSFMEEGHVKGDNTFNKLKFTLGYHNTLQAGKLIIVNEKLSMNGVTCEPVELKSDQDNMAAYIKKTFDGGQVAHVRLRDLQVQDGGQFEVVGKFDDKGNNVGWLDLTSDDDTNEGTYWGFTQKPHVENCKNITTLDVSDFPANKNTTYQWSYFHDAAWHEVGTGPSIDVAKDAAGQYKVRLKFNDKGCELNDEIEVVFSDNPHIEMTLEAFDLKCAGDNSGRIVASFADDIEFESIVCTDEYGVVYEEFTPEVSNLPAGRYYVKVTDVEGCSAEEEISVFDAYPLVMTDITPAHNICYGDKSGSLAVIADGGTGSYSYFVGGKEYNNSVIGNLSGGLYNIFVEDENNCRSAEESVQIEEPDQIVVDWLTGGLTCHGDSDGTLDPRPSGGNGSFHYQWSGPSGFSSTQPVLSELLSGEYHLHLIDVKGCEKDVTYMLQEPDPLLIDPQIIKQVDCYGASTGEVFIEASHGQGALTYRLDKQENDDGIFRNMKAGFYDIEVVDQAGCSAQTQVEVKEPLKMELLLEDKVLPSCYGGKTGQLSVGAKGGAGAYTYTWSGPDDFRAITPNIENLSAGDYHVELMDKNDCLLNQVFVLEESTELQLGVRVRENVSAGCAHDGIIVVEMMGGVPNYSFICSGPNGFVFKSPEDLNGKFYEIDNLEGGIYTVTMTDATSCNTLTKQVMLEEPGKLLAFIPEINNVSCYGDTDGSMRVSMSGGDGTYSVEWNGPDGFVGSSEFIDGLAPGKYSATVTCGAESVSVDAEVLEPSALQAHILQSQNALCFGDVTGSLELDIMGGTPGYEILWTGENGFVSHATKLIQLEAGVYNYTVKDARGCQVQSDAQVSEPDALSVTLESFAVSVSGGRDGRLQVLANGGTPDYKLYVSGPENYTINKDFSGNCSLDGLKQGVYHVNVEDKNGCTWDEDINVVKPDQLLAWVESKTDLKCNGDHDGVINLEVEGSDSFSVRWTGPDYFISDEEDIQDLVAGYYHAVVTDNLSNKTFEVETQINQPDRVDAQVWVQDVTCNGLENGYINLYPSGGTPGYTYKWEGEVDNPLLEDQSNLSAGSYQVVITDNNLCVSQPISIDVNEPESLSVTTENISPSCYGYEDGSIRLLPVNGTAPYIYSWQDKGSILDELTNLKAGDYKFTIRDKNGCILKDEDGNSVSFYQITLDQPDTLVAEILDFSNILCAGDGNGRALVSVSGGTPFAEPNQYKYLWSDGQTDSQVENLGKGEYKVVVSDGHDCIDSARVTIDEPDPIVLKMEMVRPITQGSKDGEINIDVTGGVPGYSFSWDPGNYVDSDISQLNAGKYHVEITDFNSCMVDSTITLEYRFDDRVSIPKTFTPNMDGVNDIWVIERVEFVDRVKIAVYDRWGKVIYKFQGSGDQYRGAPWDGCDGTSVLPKGSYYYAITLDDEKPIVGSVTIVR